MSAPAASPLPKSGRALLIGRSPVVMESVLAELAALGVQAVGDVDPGRAAERADAGRFDVVAIGRGVTGAERLRLRARFLARNPRVALIDVTLHGTAARVLGALGGADPEGVDLAAYFARIGYAGPVGVSLETLQALIAAHQSAIAFENLDVVSGKGVDITARAVDAKLLAGGRGGYCYEQNGLFKRVLAALGFEVDALMARVLMGRPPGQPLGRSHMCLKTTLGDEAFLVDVGFGSFTPPVALRLGDGAPRTTPHERYRLVSFGPQTRMEAEVEGVWAPMYEFSGEIQLPVDFVPANWFTATHPSSFFTRKIVAARTTDRARHALYGRRLTVREPGAPAERRELSADGIAAALGEVFGLPVSPDWRPLIERAALEP